MGEQVFFGVIIVKIDYGQGVGFGLNSVKIIQDNRIIGIFRDILRYC